MHDIIPFDYEGAAVRVVTQDGEPRFVLADICQVLDIANPRNATARLDDDEKGVHTMDTPGGAQEMTVINESGLYSLILTSRKEAAKRFKKWVTSEVLPAIRRDGGYMAAAREETPEELAVRAMAVLQATIERQKKQITNLVPKADALDRIAAADGSLSITAAAKALQVRPKDLFAYLQQNEWIYRRPGNATFYGYQPKTQAGLVTHKITTITRPDGTEKIVEQVLITSRGLTRLSAVMKQPELVN